MKKISINLAQLNSLSTEKECQPVMTDLKQRLSYK